MSNNNINTYAIIFINFDINEFEGNIMIRIGTGAQRCDVITAHGKDGETQRLEDQEIGVKWFTSVNYLTTR
jgi:hypothetical protein